jgi:DNA invertase Pin-like site-specific DNA recombinase
MRNFQDGPIRAAEYVRMSTEGQQYSIVNQQAAIREYAAPRGITIVRTYADPGRSGLLITNRPGLRQLLADVQEKRADFETILVYDVSRWGRFQDTDESGYYEFLCRRARINVEYCAEPFENNNEPITAVYKSIKRSMAAEYSREQSARVTRALHRTARMGHHAGGIPGYGYRRMLVGGDGTLKGILDPGVIRAIRTDYMTLVPGPAEEVRTVKRIFRLYAYHGWSPPRIATQFNREGKKNAIGNAWHPQEVLLILKSERYAGTLVYNKTSAKLRVPEQVNPRDQWIRVPNAFEPLVSRQLFDDAQKIVHARRHQFHTKASLLERLRELWKEHGHLSQAILQQHPYPTSHMFYSHFGSLRAAYEAVGFKDIRRGHLDIVGLLARAAVETAVYRRLAEALRGAGIAANHRRWHRIIAVNSIHRLAIRPVSFFLTPIGRKARWRLRITRRLDVTATIIVRLAEGDTEILDYFMLPAAAFDASRSQLTLTDPPRAALRRYHHVDFEGLLAAVKEEVSVHM